MQLPLATADAQLAAIEAVTKRSDRLTKRVGACIVGPAVPACFLAYAAIREIQFALWNINIAYLSWSLRPGGHPKLSNHTYVLLVCGMGHTGPSWNRERFR
jgi:hypothetical protein